MPHVTAPRRRRGDAAGASTVTLDRNVDRNMDLDQGDSGKGRSRFSTFVYGEAGARAVARRSSNEAVTAGGSGRCAGGEVAARVAIAKMADTKRMHGGGGIRAACAAATAATATTGVERASARRP